MYMGMGDSKDRRFSKWMLDWVFYSAPESSLLPYWPCLDPAPIPFCHSSQAAKGLISLIMTPPQVESQTTRALGPI